MIRGGETKVYPYLDVRFQVVKFDRLFFLAEGVVVYLPRSVLPPRVILELINSVRRESGGVSEDDTGTGRAPIKT